MTETLKYTKNDCHEIAESCPHLNKSGVKIGSNACQVCGYNDYTIGNTQIVYCKYKDMTITPKTNSGMSEGTCKNCAIWQEEDIKGLEVPVGRCPILSDYVAREDENYADNITWYKFYSHRHSLLDIHW